MFNFSRQIVVVAVAVAVAVVAVVAVAVVVVNCYALAENGLCKKNSGNF